MALLGYVTAVKKNGEILLENEIFAKTHDYVTLASLLTVLLAMFCIHIRSRKIKRVPSIGDSEINV